jgi:hypothetical protein
MYAEVLRHLNGDQPIAREELRRWIESGDPLTWSAVYALTETSWARIRPEPAPEEQVEFVRRYLLRCIEENPAPGDYLHGGYEAAWELAARLTAWRRRGGRAASAVRDVAADLGRLYADGDAAMRNRILCGVLEHAFEDPKVRPYFAKWDRDDKLREAYKLAADWGSAHTQE